MNAEDFKRERAAYNRRAIPELIDLLAHPQLRVRFLAEMALRDATGT